MTLLIDHAAFDVAVFTVLRSDLELLTALRGWGSHIYDEGNDKDDEKGDDSDDGDDERGSLIHRLTNHSSKSHEGHGHESGDDKSDRNAFHGFRDVIAIHPLSHAGKEDDDDKETD